MTGREGGRGAGATLNETRLRWQRSGRPPAGAPRVGLLATYTVDPLVPYLGVATHDAGLPVEPRVGPFNQVVQQCVDDAGDMAAWRPDVLVVAPRLEELPDAVDLLRCADAAVSAADRWGSLLLFVLPAVPPERPYGAGDGGRPAGRVASAGAVREALRGRLAGLAGVSVADADEAVRAVGERAAYRPSLFRFAGIPYAEPVFAALAAQLAALLRLWYAGPRRLVVLDADSILRPAGGDDGRPPPARVLEPALAALHRAGTRLAVRSTGAPDEVWAALVAALPAVARDCLDGWVVDDRPPRAHVAELVGGAGLTPRQAVLVYAGDADPVDAPCPLAGLGPDPDEWPAELRAAGVFDRLPPAEETPAAAAPAEETPAAATSGPVPLSLAGYVAGLDVRLSFEPLTPATAAQASRIVAAAHDFTFGSGIDPAAPDERRVLVVSVRDRLGDYGPAAVVGYHLDTGVCVVDLFSVSCPVLGKGVEAAVLRELVERAAAAGGHTIELRCPTTARNAVAVGFVAAAAGKTWPVGPGREVAVVAGPAGRAEA